MRPAVACMVCVVTATLVVEAAAQQMVVSVDRASGVYAVGETVRWTVAWKGDGPAPAARYVVKSGGLTEVDRGELTFTENVATVEAKFDTPNTLLLEVTWEPKGPASRAFAGAVAAPDKISPAAPPPDDFDAFWKAKLDELATVPSNPKLEQTEAGKPNVDYWKVTLANIRGTHVNGQLARPVKGEKFPALLILQWAGVYPLQKAWVTDRAAEGWLAMNVLPHDLPIDNPESFYKEQYDGPLKNYWAIGNDDPDKSYYLRMYLSCVRALDFLKSRSDWDGKTLVVIGASQGGQQALALAGLQPDSVTAVLPFLPAACDMLAPDAGRASGFPNWYVQTWGGRDAKKVRETSRYYDPVNFARKIKCPVLIGLGLHDDLAPPSSVLAAANVITAPKEVIILANAGHQDELGSQKPYNDRAYGAWLPALRQGKPPPVASHPTTASSSPQGAADQPAARNDDPVWVAKHAELRERAKQGGIDLYFVGDSITRRWPADFRENWDRNLGGWRAASFGAGGDRTQNVLYRLENGELAGVNPKVVVLMIGTNNVGPQAPAAGGEDALVGDVANGVAACLRTIRQLAPDAKVLLMGITPRNTDGRAAVMPTIEKINGRIAKLADGRTVRFLSINDQFADATGKLREGVTIDGLHFSDRGYQIWADAMKPILVEWLGPPAAATQPATQQATPAGTSAAEQDHRRMLDLLKIDKLRRGADANPSSQFAANSDETKAGTYELPDPLVLHNGERVTSPEVWRNQRRPEIVELFDREIYGRVPKNVPAVKWDVASSANEQQHGMPVVTKQLVGRVDNSAHPAISVEIQMTLTTPAQAAGPVPVVMEFSFARPRGATTRGAATRGGSGGGRAPASRPADAGPPWQQQVLQRGWGYATLSPSTIQADNGAGLTQGIIGLANKGQPRKTDDWGALRAWAWGASRALDYFETDESVDARRVCIEGLSRYGKAALVTMAYDERFAVGFIASSGAGGAKLLRRDFGERVENLASAAEYHWFAGNFLKYAGPLTPADLPVDAHELIALCAPRPVFISVGSPTVEGTWVDAKGMFLATVAAGPVYRLLGTKDLGTSEFPPIETGLVGGDLAFRQHAGGHTAAPNWPAFLDLAGRYFAPSAPDHSASSSGGGK